MARRILLRAVLAALMLFASACSSGDAGTATSVEGLPAVTSATADSDPPATTAVVETDDGFVPDYAVLIATIESAMKGTSYEGVALTDPEVFIATAELFCDLLEEGMTTDDLLAEYLDRLAEEGEVEVDEDDGLMAGVLLGASTKIVCPEQDP